MPQRRPRAKRGEMVVYGLYSPRSARCRYVGSTRNAPARLSVHMAAGGGGAGRLAWVGALRRRGERPRMVILERVDSLAALAVAEAAWIVRMRDRGEPLTNGVGVRPRRCLTARQATLALDPGLLSALETLHAADRTRRHQPNCGCDPKRLCLRQDLARLLEGHARAMIAAERAALELYAPPVSS